MGVMAEERPVLNAHGARRLPSVEVDSYNLEIKDEDGFVGDKASRGAFHGTQRVGQRRGREGAPRAQLWTRREAQQHTTTEATPGEQRVEQHRAAPSRPARPIVAQRNRSEAMERGSLGDGFAGAEGEAGRFP